MRLIDIENIDYVRLEDSLHCLEHHKGDEVECVICAPTVEVIPKSEYEQRLKADIVAMLTDIQLEIEELRAKKHFQYKHGQEHGLNDASGIIQQKINALKAESEDKEWQNVNL